MVWIDLSMVPQRLRSFWRNDRGTALIESAIVLPVFLLLVGGIYEFGYFFYQQQLMTIGVRDAARYLALTSDPNSATSQADAINLAVYGSISGGITPRVSNWSTDDLMVSVTAANDSSVTYCGGCAVEIITVAASRVDPSLGFLGLLGLKPLTISVSHQERWIGGSAVEG
jgi:Flp pilus assembly protein TadG